MNAKTLEAIRIHGETLLAIFPNATEKDPVALCKKLRRVEAVAHRFATDYCNGLIRPCEDSDIDRETDKILGRADKLLGFRASKVPVFLNTDARGYALKIRDEWARAWNDVRRTEGKRPLHTDWGQFGILAPDLTVDGKEGR